MALKYLNLISLIFCQPQITFFDIYSFRYLQNKKYWYLAYRRFVSWIWHINRKILSACVATKIKKITEFPSEPHCGLKVHEKFNFYEIWNFLKYYENSFAIYVFLLNISNPYNDLLFQRSSIHVFPVV